VIVGGTVGPRPPVGVGSVIVMIVMIVVIVGGTVGPRPPRTAMQTCIALKSAAHKGKSGRPLSGPGTAMQVCIALKSAAHKGKTVGLRAHFRAAPKPLCKLA
jgi:hypothetical protein